MNTFSTRVEQVTSCLLIPYLVIVIFTIPYFAYQKYLIGQQLRNVPASTVLAINLTKVKKNLEIKSLTHSFIITIYCFEAFVCLSSSVSSISQAFGISYSEHDLAVAVNINANHSCYLHRKTIVGLFLDIGGSLALFLPIPLNLFIIVLRRAYLNVPYKKWVKGFAIYFLFRLLYDIISSYCLITFYIKHIMELPFILFDVYVFGNSSRKFYLLLKGLREEAKWHSTPQKYRERRRTTRFFAVTQTLYLLASIIGVTIVLMNSLNDIDTIILKSDCLQHYIFPATPIYYSVPSSLTHFIYHVSYYCQTIRMFCSGILGTIAFLSNLAILSWVVVDLLRRRRKFKHVNTWLTRPLMERYLNEMERGNRHNNRRPPFIQAFRSNTVY